MPVVFDELFKILTVTKWVVLDNKPASAVPNIHLDSKFCGDCLQHGGCVHSVRDKKHKMI
jgi:hypothetical protein